MKRLPPLDPAPHTLSPADAPTLASIVFERAPYGISLTSARPESFGRYVLANPAYCRISGLGIEELERSTVRDVIHPDDLPGALASAVDQTHSGVANLDTELRLQRRDGSEVWVRQNRIVIYDDAGEPLYQLTRTEDISERRARDAVVDAARTTAESALRDSEARYRLLAEHAADMIVCTRPDRTRSYVSPASKRLLGFEPAKMIDLDFTTFLHPDDRAAVALEHAQFLARGGAETHTYRLRHKDGHYVWVEAHWVAIAPGTLTNGTVSNSVFIATVRDISERRTAEDAIATLFRHDSLTGLPNRLMLRERLDQAQSFVQAGGSIAVLSIDLDHFKAVNDTLGHAIGDALLKEVALRLLRCVRQNDTVARLGGDEFVAILVGLDSPEEAARRGRTIVDVISEPYQLDGHQVQLSASVGITTSPRDGIFPDQLLKNADLALYAAKGEGRRASCLFDPRMAAKREIRLQTEAELRAALDDESFVVFYQPVVSLASNQIVGFEALTRWRHAERGLIYPDEFIPLAEETGMIVPLGAWVLHEACREAAQWSTPIRISVNVSSIQFKGSKFVATVCDALEASGLPAHRLDLEITESVLLQENDGTLAVLNELRALGVGLSLDDFGTGYSSLGYLSRFRFDRIKIDQSFVRDVLERTESEAIVRAVVGIGNSLGIATVAEGVETQAQLHALQFHGCTEAQGFIFSKARPPDELGVMLASFADRLTLA